jgi:uncharacterized protein (UPF0261 family)
VPGGLDCAVLEFTRDNIPQRFRDRKIFFYDFRSAVRLDEKETRHLANQLAEKLNLDTHHCKVLIPMRGWSEADRVNGPLYDSQMRDAFLESLRQRLDPRLDLQEADLHINDREFARCATELMDAMMRKETQGVISDVR